MSRGESLLIGTYSGLYSYSSETHQLALLNRKARDKSVTAMFEKGGTLYWAAANGEVYSLSDDNTPEVLHRFSSPVKRILEFHDKIIFALSDGGVYSLSESKMTVLIDSTQYPSEVSLNDILVYGDMLLLLTGEGIIVVNQKMETLGNFCSQEIVLKGALSEKYIYFATHSSGIIIYDTMAEDIALWDLKTGMPSLNIPAIEVWGNRVIISTPEKGILLIDEELQEKL